jgi:hypothetical protein
MTPIGTLEKTPRYCKGRGITLCLHWEYARTYIGNTPEQHSVFDTKDVDYNPVHRLAKARIPSVDHYEIFISNNCCMFILERWRNALNEVEKTFATRRDVSTMLDVFGRPIVLSCYVVTLVEECVESFKDKFFVFFLLIKFDLRHIIFASHSLLNWQVTWNFRPGAGRSGLCSNSKIWCTYAHCQGHTTHLRPQTICD